VNDPPDMSSSVSLLSLAYPSGNKKIKLRVSCNSTTRKTCLFPNGRKLSLKFKEGKRLCVPDHWCDETLWSRDRNAEVHIVAINNLVTLFVLHTCLD
jgi:hypothetical protein